MSKSTLKEFRRRAGARSENSNEEQGRHGPHPRPGGTKQRYRRKTASSCQAFHENSNLRESQLSEKESERNVQRKF